MFYSLKDTETPKHFVWVFLFFSMYVTGFSQEDMRLIDIVEYQGYVELGELDDFRFNNNSTQAFDYPYFCYLSKESGDLIVVNLLTKRRINYEVRSKGWHELKIVGEKVYLITQKSVSNCNILELAIKDSVLEEVSREKHENIQYFYKDLSTAKYGYCNVWNKDPISKIVINGRALDVKFEYPFMTIQQPTNYMDFTSERALVCQATNYKIEIFNNNLKSDGVIKLSSGEYFNPSLESVEQISHGYRPGSPSEVIPSLKKYLMKYDMIWGAYFLTNESIFLVRSIGSTNAASETMEFRFDIWEKRPMGWKPKYVNIKSFYPEGEMIIGKECLPFTLFEYGSRFWVKNGKLYVLKQDIPSNSFGVTVNQYRQNQESFYSLNSGYYKLYIYRFKDEF